MNRLDLLVKLVCVVPVASEVREGCLDVVGRWYITNAIKGVLLGVQRAVRGGDYLDHLAKHIPANDDVFLRVFWCFRCTRTSASGWASSSASARTSATTFGRWCLHTIVFRVGCVAVAYLCDRPMTIKKIWCYCRAILMVSSHRPLRASRESAWRCCRPSGWKQTVRRHQSHRHAHSRAGETRPFGWLRCEGSSPQKREPTQLVADVVLHARE